MSYTNLIKNDDLRKTIFVIIEYYDTVTLQVEKIYVASNSFTGLSEGTSGDQVHYEGRLKDLPFFEQEVDPYTNEVIVQGSYKIELFDNDKYLRDNFLNLAIFKNQKVKIYSHVEGLDLNDSYLLATATIEDYEIISDSILFNLKDISQYTNESFSFLTKFSDSDGFVSEDTKDKYKPYVFGKSDKTPVNNLRELEDFVNIDGIKGGFQVLSTLEPFSVELYLLIDSGYEDDFIKYAKKGDKIKFDNGDEKEYEIERFDDDYFTNRKVYLDSYPEYGTFTGVDILFKTEYSEDVNNKYHISDGKDKDYFEITGTATAGNNYLTVNEDCSWLLEDEYITVEQYISDVLQEYKTVQYTVNYYDSATGRLYVKEKILEDIPTNTPLIKYNYIQKIEVQDKVFQKGTKESIISMGPISEIVNQYSETFNADYKGVNFALIAETFPPTNPTEGLVSITNPSELKMCGTIFIMELTIGLGTSGNDYLNIEFESGTGTLTVTRINSQLYRITNISTTTTLGDIKTAFDAVVSSNSDGYVSSYPSGSSSSTLADQFGFINGGLCCIGENAVLSRTNNSTKNYVVQSLNGLATSDEIHNVVSNSYTALMNNPSEINSTLLTSGVVFSEVIDIDLDTADFRKSHFIFSYCDKNDRTLRKNLMIYLTLDGFLPGQAPTNWAIQNADVKLEIEVTTGDSTTDIQTSIINAINTAGRSIVLPLYALEGTFGTLKVKALFEDSINNYYTNKYNFNGLNFRLSTNRTFRYVFDTYINNGDLCLEIFSKHLSADTKLNTRTSELAYLNINGRKLTYYNDDTFTDTTGPFAGAGEYLVLNRNYNFNTIDSFDDAFNQKMSDDLLFVLNENDDNDVTLLEYDVSAEIPNGNYTVNLSKCDPLEIGADDIFVYYKDENQHVSDLITELNSLYNVVDFNSSDLSSLKSSYPEFESFLYIDDNEQYYEYLNQYLLSFSLGSYIDSAGDVRYKLINTIDLGSANQLDYYDILEDEEKTTGFEFNSVNLQYGYNLKDDKYIDNIQTDSELDNISSVLNFNKRKDIESLILTDIFSTAIGSNTLEEILSNKYFRHRKVVTIRGKQALFSYNLLDTISFFNHPDISSDEKFLVYKRKTNGRVVELELISFVNRFDATAFWVDDGENNFVDENDNKFIF